MYFHLHGYIHMTTEPFTVETTRLRDGCYIIVLEYWVIQKESKSVENYIYTTGIDYQKLHYAFFKWQLKQLNVKGMLMYNMKYMNSAPL